MLPHRVTVLGAGSWGAALGVLLCHNLDRVTLWGRNRERIRAMAGSRRSPDYLPGVVLPDNLAPVEDFQSAVHGSDGFVVAVPSHAFGATLGELAAALQQQGRDPAHAPVIWGCKGFDPEAGRLLSEVASSALGESSRTGMISGPSFATETARGLPTALTVASGNAGDAESWAHWFRGPTTRVYFSDDLVGVQLGSAIKNVMAIAAGISDGLGFGANARAALITRGLSELTRLGVALGGKPETFMGLTGVGDLVLTCTDDQSRNRRFGIGLGQGRGKAEMVREIGQEIEGIQTTATLRRISRRHAIDMPITEQVYRIVHEDADPAAAVRSLLSRNPRAENG